MRLRAEADYDSLTTAVRRAVRKGGGLESVASITRVSKSSLHNYQTHTGVFPPLDVVLDIETDVGEPFVTRQMAALQGYKLERVDPSPHEVGDPLHAIPKLVKELGDFADAVERAANDGTYTPRELDEMLKEADDLAEVVNKARDRLHVLKRRHTLREVK